MFFPENFAGNRCNDNIRTAGGRIANLKEYLFDISLVHLSFPVYNSVNFLCISCELFVDKVQTGSAYGLGSRRAAGHFAGHIGPVDSC